MEPLCLLLTSVLGSSCRLEYVCVCWTSCSIHASSICSIPNAALSSAMLINLLLHALPDAVCISIYYAVGLYWIAKALARLLWQAIQHNIFRCVVCFARGRLNTGLHPYILLRCRYGLFVHYGL